jgi:nicotinamide mononucleotide transporter
VQKGIPFRAGLFALYVIIAIAGYFKWKTMLKVKKKKHEEGTG